MEYMMTERPAFEELSSYKEFQKYYWYRAELVEICKSIGVDHTGVKTELNHNIAEYFKGNRIKKSIPLRVIRIIRYNHFGHTSAWL